MKTQTRTTPLPAAITAALLALLLAPAAMFAQAPKITSATATLQSSSTTATTVTYVFSGKVVASEPGTIQYRWRHSDNDAATQLKSMTLAKAGTHSIANDTWTVTRTAQPQQLKIDFAFATTGAPVSNLLTFTVPALGAATTTAGATTAAATKTTTARTTTTAATTAAKATTASSAARSANDTKASTVATGAALANAPTITTHPASVTINTGQSATFTVAVGGNLVPTYQWQYAKGASPSWYDLPASATYGGVTNAKLTITGATDLINGYQYRCVVKNAAGTVTSNAAALTVIKDSLSITTHPADATAIDGATVTYKVAVTANPAPSYQWQFITPGNNSGNYAKVSDSTIYSGATTGTLTIKNVSTAANGYKYRCAVTNPAGTANSNAATLNVTASTLKSITLTLTNQTAKPADARVHVRIKHIAPNGASTQNIATDSVGYNVAYNPGSTQTYTIPITASRPISKAEVAGLIPEISLQSASNAATWSFKPVFAFAFTEGPAHNITAPGDGMVTIQGQGNASTDYRSINALATIKLDGIADNGTSVTYKFAAKANAPHECTRDITCRWVNRIVNGTSSTTPSKNITLKAGENTIDPYTVTIEKTATAINRQMYFQVQGAYGMETSWFTFTVPANATSAPVVTKHPANASGNDLHDSVFEATFTANPKPTLQWQYITKTGATWANVTNSTNYTTTSVATGMETTGKLVFKRSISMFDGYRFRCIATNSLGAVTSNTATFTYDYDYTPPGSSNSSSTGSSSSTGGSSSSSDSGSSSTPLKATSPIARVDSQTQTSNTEMTVKFTGSVVTDKSGTVWYRWQFSDNSFGESRTVTASKAGTIAVHPYEKKFKTDSTKNMWVTLEITSPNKASSSQATFTLPEVHAITFKIAPGGVNGLGFPGGAWLPSTSQYSLSGTWNPNYLPANRIIRKIKNTTTKNVTVAELVSIGATCQWKDSVELRPDETTEKFSGRPSNMALCLFAASSTSPTPTLQITVTNQ